MKNLLIIICTAFILMGCTYSHPQADKRINKDVLNDIYRERFICVYVGNGVHVIIDKETRVQYLAMEGCMRVLVDSTVNPHLYEE